MADENVSSILTVLGQIDLLIEITDELNLDIDKLAVSDDYLKLVGSANIFDLMRSSSQLKAVLHNMSANLMDASRLQALKESKENKKGLSPNDRVVTQDLAHKASEELKKEESDNRSEKDSNKKNKHIGNALEYFKDRMEDNIEDDGQDNSSE